MAIKFTSKEQPAPAKAGKPEAPKRAEPKIAVAADTVAGTSAPAPSGSDLFDPAPEASAGKRKKK